MKNVIKTIILLCSILSCAGIFADTVTNTTTSVIKNTPNTSNNTTQSTVTHITTSSAVNNDDKIVTAIYAKYAKASALIGTSLIVECKNGSVTISGTVTQQSQADEAVIAAKSVPGVKDVRSNIIVITHPNTTPPAQTPNY